MFYYLNQTEGEEEEIDSNVLQNLFPVGGLPFENKENRSNNNIESTEVVKMAELVGQVDADSSKPWACRVCNKRFAMKRGMQVHIETIHENTRKYECAFCSRVFNQKGNLNNHIKVSHENCKDFKCELCEWKFSAVALLDKHMVTVHKVELKYDCDQCNQEFTNRKLLRKHKVNFHKDTSGNRTHEIKKRVFCAFCSQGFSFQNLLDKHIAFAHSGKAFACKVCDKSFENQSALDGHVQSKHKQIHLQQQEEQQHQKIQIQQQQHEGQTIHHIIIQPPPVQPQQQEPPATTTVQQQQLQQQILQQEQQRQQQLQQQQQQNLYYQQYNQQQQLLQQQQQQQQQTFYQATPIQAGSNIQQQYLLQLQQQQPQYQIQELQLPREIRLPVGTEATAYVHQATPVTQAQEQHRIVLQTQDLHRLQPAHPTPPPAHQSPKSYPTVVVVANPTLSQAHQQPQLTAVQSQQQTQRPTSIFEIFEDSAILQPKASPVKEVIRIVEPVKAVKSSPPKPQPIKCEECSDFTTLEEKELIKHKALLHSFKCDSCLLKFPNFQALASHKLTAHLTACPCCRVGFEERAELARHFVESHPEKELCSHCLSTFDSPEDLKDHLTSEHGTDFKIKYEEDKAEAEKESAEKRKFADCVDDLVVQLQKYKERSANKKRKTKHESPGETEETNEVKKESTFVFENGNGTNTAKIE